MKIDSEVADLKQDFWTDYQANADQRDKANEELRFLLAPGGQWEGYLTDAYTNRAKLEVDQISEYLWRTYADWCDDRLSVSFEPEGIETNSDDAKLLEGLYRRDLRRDGGQDSIDTAVLEQHACGYGAVMLNTEYDDELDPDNQYQNICITEIPNAYSNVVFDSGARRADKADARRCTILVPYTRDEFQHKYPDADTSGVTSQNRREFNWNTKDFIYVGHRYSVDSQSIRISTWGNPATGEIVRLEGRKQNEEDARELISAGFNFLREKQVKRRKILKTVFNGNQILEKERRISGQHIPVIPFYGYRGFIDGVEYFYGLARRRMDAQRLLNMSFSLAAEGAAASHESKPIFAPEQVAAPGIKTTWSQNRHQAPYLLADPIRDESGNIVHAGPLANLPGSELAPAAAQLIEMTYEHIRSGTGGAPQDIADPEASGKAINALIKRIDKNVAPIRDNIRKSLRHLGAVYLSMAQEVYGGRANIGRTMQIVNERDESTPIQLMASKADNGGLIRTNDPSKGKFQVVVSTSKSFSSQREEAVEGLKDILAAMAENDPLRPDVLNEIIRLLPIEGLDGLKEKVRKQQLMAGAKPETPEEEAFIQQMAQASGGPDPNTLYLQAAAEEQKTEAMKNLASIENTRADTLLKYAKAEETRANIFTQ